MSIYFNQDLYSLLLQTYVLGQKHRGRKEGSVLFNDAFNTFYLRLYGIRHMVKETQRKPKIGKLKHFVKILKCFECKVLRSGMHFNGRSVIN